MWRHPYLLPLPRRRFDVVEAIKTGFIYVIGAIYVALLAGILLAGIWIYATSKSVT